MKTFIEKTILGCFVVAILASCGVEDVAPHSWLAPEVSLGYTPDIAAHYEYNLDSIQWTLNSPEVPQQGAYLSTDYAAVGRQVQTSLDNGINVWIFDWVSGSGAGNTYIGVEQYWADTIINDYINNVPEFANMQYMIRYNLSHNMTDAYSIFRMDSALSVVDDHFGNSNYYKLNSKPVLMLNDGNIFPRLLPSLHPELDPRVEELKTIRSNLEAAAGEVFILLDVMRWNPAQRFFDINRFADAVTGANVANNPRSELIWQFHEATYISFESWHAHVTSDSIGTKFIPPITPGVNDTTTFYAKKWGKDPVTGEPVVETDTISNKTNWVIGTSTDFFRQQIKVAKNFVDPDLKLVVLHSWNDWHNGNGVEPSEQRGDALLQVLRDELK